MRKLTFNLFALMAGVCLSGNIAHAQIINTISGDGFEGYTGDGGAAISARVNQPDWITGDASGNYYVVDRSNNCIRKIDASGTITTIAGTGTAGFSGDGGPATAARLNSPSGAVLDAAGNLYIADSYNNRIRKVDASGTITTIAGTGATGDGGDGGPALSAQFNTPYGLVFDAAGDLIVSDEMNNRIRLIRPSGIIQTIAGTGTGGYGGDGGPALAADMWAPHYMCYDATGNLFVMDNTNHRVRKINTLGNISTVAGIGYPGYSGDGGPASAAAINWASGMKVDASGNLYICDQYNNRIRMISTTGIITTFAGTGSSTFSGDGGAPAAAGMPWPADIYIDDAGNMAVAEIGDSRIRKISMPTSPVNHPPIFVLGDMDSLHICPGEMPHSIALLLPVADADAGQTLTWSLISAPGHGIASVAYTATSTGGTVTPVGPTYTPASGFVGSDTFTVQVSDGSLYDSITIVVTVVAPPTGDTIVGADTICAGSTTLLTDASGAGTWSVYDSTIVTVDSATGVVSAVGSGLGVVMYTETNMCGSSATSHNIWVNPLPVAGTITGADSVCPGDTILLANTMADGTWSVASTTISSISSTVVVTGVAAGINTVFYTVTNSCGTATASYTIVTRTYCGPEAVSTASNSDLGIYPNPSNGTFSIELPYTMGNARFTFTNMLGQQVATYDAVPGKPVACKLQVAAGTYLVEVQTGKDKLVKKITIK